MATATDNLEEEVHELERSEAALERRAESLALTSVLGFVFAFAALAASVAAIVIAASNTDGGNGPMMNGNANGTPGVGGAMSGGMMGNRTSGANAAPAGVHRIDVQLGEMWVRPRYSSVSAGRVTFVARNTGQVEHELMIERMPLKMDAPAQPNEEAAQGMIEEMGPGEGGKMTLNLKPGNYVLFCNVTGHYAAGQHIPFTVTGS